jgi:hypothetical protein
MATWDDVRAITLDLPETVEETSRGGTLSWSVRRKGFVWERPLGKAGTAELGDAAPTGPVLGVRVDDLGVQQAWIQADPAVFFIIAHFAGYPAVLVRLDDIGVDALREVVVEAWLAVAPTRLADAFLREHPDAAAGPEV